MRHTLWILAVALLVVGGCGRSGGGSDVAVAPSTEPPAGTNSATTTDGANLVAPPGLPDPPASDHTALFDPAPDLPPIDGSDLADGGQGTGGSGDTGPAGDAAGVIQDFVDGGLRVPPSGPPDTPLVELGPELPQVEPLAQVTVGGPGVPEPATALLGLLGIMAAAGALSRRTRPV